MVNDLIGETPTEFQDCNLSHYDARRRISKRTLKKIAVNLGLTEIQPPCGLIFNIIRGQVVSVNADGDVPNMDWFSGELYDFLMNEAERIIAL